MSIDWQYEGWEGNEEAAYYRHQHVVTVDGESGEPFTHTHSDYNAGDHGHHRVGEDGRTIVEALFMAEDGTVRTLEECRRRGYEPLWFEDRERVTRELDGNDLYRYMIRTAAHSNYWMNTPDNREFQLPSDEVLELPHWKHCVANLSAGDNYLKFDFDWESQVSKHSSDSFVFGNAGAGMKEWFKVRGQLAQARRQIASAEATRDTILNRKYSIRDGILAAARGVGGYDIEELRTSLMTGSDIIDVRFGGEMIDLSWARIPMITTVTSREHRGASGTYVVPDGAMMVTFVGTSFRGPNGVCPLPPIMVTFHQQGNVLGGPLCIHPHIAPDDICQGNARNVLTACSERGDVRAAVDIMRTYLLGYDKASPLVRGWEMLAWDWWCRLFAMGLPTEEPFQKPWIQYGMPVQDHVKASINPLSAVLGFTNEAERLNAAHLGRQATWYSRSKLAKTLGEITAYIPPTEVPIGSLCYYCQGPRSGIEVESSLCGCHGNPAQNDIGTCDGCGNSPIDCRCLCVKREHWLRRPAPTDYYCEAFDEQKMTMCRQRGGRMDIYSHTNSLSQTHLYNGVRIVCERHTPWYVDADGIIEQLRLEQLNEEVEREEVQPIQYAELWSREAVSV